MKIFSILLIAIISFNSCGNSNKETSKKLTGEFHIISIGDNEELQDHLTITFDNEINKISGYSGCNNFFGSYTLKAESLTFGQIGSTRKMCFGDANKIEAEMLKYLSEINTFSFNNNTLLLKKDDTILIKAQQ